MSTPDSASQNAIAVNVDSAPTPVTPDNTVTPAVEQVEQVETVDSAPTDSVVDTVVDDKVPKHIEELKTQRKKRQEAERDAAYWRGVAEARAAGDKPQAQEVKPQAPTAPVAPSLDDFQTFEEYEQAKEEYTEQKILHRIQQQQIQSAQQREHLNTRQQFEKRIADASEADPAIADIASDPTLPVSPGMATVIQSSEMAPQLLKWLDSNRKEAANIAKMNPIMAARELGMIEFSLKATPKPAPPKTVSAAPEPISTVTPAGSAIIDEDDLPMEEYHRRRTLKMLGKA